MSYLTHSNRNDDVNYNEDFEESIARNLKEEFDNESEGEFFQLFSHFSLAVFFIIFYFFALFHLISLLFFI